jgi:hypothetical protein
MCSAPQYTVCDLGLLGGPSKLKETHENDAGHNHNAAEKLNCYTLIFPLYVAGRSEHFPNRHKHWILKQLRHIDTHFRIRDADFIAQVLENGGDSDAWGIYAFLGGYAFVA